MKAKFQKLLLSKFFKTKQILNFNRTSSWKNCSRLKIFLIRKEIIFLFYQNLLQVDSQPSSFHRLYNVLLPAFVCAQIFIFDELWCSNLFSWKLAKPDPFSEVSFDNEVEQRQSRSFKDFICTASMMGTSLITLVCLNALHNLFQALFLFPISAECFTASFHPWNRNWPRNEFENLIYSVLRCSIYKRCQWFEIKHLVALDF